VYHTALHALGSSLSLTGAFAIGWALHRSLWVGDIGLLSPPAVGAVAVGVALVAGGQYVERRYDRPGRDAGASEGEDEGGAENESEEYDDSLAPVDEETLADSDAERDESRD
jgi:hypothetical protein